MINKRFLFTILFFLGTVFFEMYGEPHSLLYGYKVYIKNYNNYMGHDGSKLVRKGTDKSSGCIFQILASVKNPQEKKWQPVRFGDFIYLKVVASQAFVDAAARMAKMGDQSMKGFTGDLYVTLLNKGFLGLTHKPEEARMFQFALKDKSHYGKEMPVNAAFRLVPVVNGMPLDIFMTWLDVGNDTFMSKEDSYRSYRQSFQLEFGSAK